MTVCAPNRAEAVAAAQESFEWYPRHGAHIIGELAAWMKERDQDLGNYAYAGDMRAHDEQGLLDHLTLDYLTSTTTRACSGRPTSASTRAAATKRPASTCCCASSTPTRCRTTRSCRPSS